MVEMTSSAVGVRQNSASLRSREAEHQRPVRGVAAGLLPQLERLGDRQRDLLRARRIHLLSHDLRHLGEDPLADRQPRIDAARQAPDAPRPQQQPVTVDLGVGRVVAEGAQEEARHPHGRRG